MNRLSKSAPDNQDDFANEALERKKTRKSKRSNNNKKKRNTFDEPRIGKVGKKKDKWRFDPKKSYQNPEGEYADDYEDEENDDYEGPAREEE